jgi:hypothetical protein
MKGNRTLDPKSSVPQKDADSNLNWGQQDAKAVRPQLPRDSTQRGHNRWTPGTMPKGGFRSVFDFSDGPESSKISVTEGGGRKIY